MATGGSSSERELAMLGSQLRALEEDITRARAAEAQAQTGLDLLGRRRPERAGPRLAGERVRLRDGAEILIRQIGPEDAPDLEHGLEHLSAVTRYRRFRRDVSRFSPRELDELTRIDHRTHEALVALDPVARDGIGVARYICADPDDPQRAEVYVVVADAWQGRGVGTALVRRLAARARASGIDRLTATMLAGDTLAHSLLARNARITGERRDGGIVQVTARL